MHKFRFAVRFLKIIIINMNNKAQYSLLKKIILIFYIYFNYIFYYLFQIKY